MKKLNNIGSVLVEKILMTIVSVTLAFSSVICINNIIKTAIKEQGNHVVVETNSHMLGDKVIKQNGNTFTYVGPEKVDFIYIGLFSTEGKYVKSINDFANTKITIPNNAGRMSIIYYTPSIQNKWHSINYDMKNYQGKSFYVMCDISPDNKIISNLKFTSQSEGIIIPEFPTFSSGGN